MTHIDGYVYKFVEIGNVPAQYYYIRKQWYRWTKRIDEVYERKVKTGHEIELQPIEIDWRRFVRDLQAAARKHALYCEARRMHHDEED